MTLVSVNLASCDRFLFFFIQFHCGLKKKKKKNTLAIALYFSVLSLVVEGINNEMFTAWQKMEAI